MLVSRYLFIKLDQFKQNSFGPFIRYVGQSLIRAGEKFQGELKQGDRSKSLNYIIKN